MSTSEAQLSFCHAASNKALNHRCFQRKQSSQRRASSQTIINVLAVTSEKRKKAVKKLIHKDIPLLFQPRSATPMRSSSGFLHNEAGTSLGCASVDSGSSSCHGAIMDSDSDHLFGQPNLARLKTSIFANGQVWY